MSDRGYEPIRPGDEPPPPPDRRLWIVAGILAVIAVIAVALLLTTLDDDDEDVATTDSTLVESTTTESTTTSTSSTTTTTPSTTTTEATTTTSPPVETTTTSAAPPVTADPAQCREAGADATDPEAPAQAVFIAWTRGDTSCAQELMTDDAFDELFGRSGAGAQDDFQGCSENTEGDPYFDCAFTYEGGATHYLMNFSATDGWQVFDITQVAD